MASSSGVNGIVRPVSTTYVGVNNVVRAANRSYVGVANAVRPVNRTYVGVYAPVLEILVKLSRCDLMTNVKSDNTASYTSCPNAAAAAEIGSYSLSSDEKTFSVTSTTATKGLYFSGEIYAVCGDGSTKLFKSVADVTSLNISVTHWISGSGSSWYVVYNSNFFGEDVWETTKTFTAAPQSNQVSISAGLAYGSRAVSTMSLGRAMVNGLEVPIKFVFEAF